MKFSSFVIFTAAGLAIAAPITPVSPSNLEKKLTVEPVEVVKRQTPSVSSLGALTGAVPGGLPVKRQTPSVDSLEALTGAVPGGLPVKRDDILDRGALRRSVSGGVQARQLGGLIPSSSSTDDSSESAESKEPKIPKEPKEPSSVTDGTTEIDDGTAEDSTSSAASALGGLPIGKRQSSTHTSTEDTASAADEIDSGLLEEGPVEETSSAIDGLSGAAAGAPVRKRQLDGITEMLAPKPAPAPDADKPADAAEEAPAAEEPKEGEAEEETAPEGDAPAEEEAAPPAEEKSALAGILKQAEEDTTTIKGQTNKADDGTNGANSFDAAEKAAVEPATEEATAPAEEKTAEAKPVAEAAPAAKNATEPAAAPAKTEKASGLAGLLGM
ncbi:hypothetical protein Q7P35_001246 [Cladosporium inversicolor]